MTRITLVAAMARANIIGRQGGMPWHLPADLQHFKRITLGKPVVMGRHTFESIGRPLPKRRNIVVSRSGRVSDESVERASSLEQALKLAGDSEVMVIGGGEIYRAALPLANRMELTFIAADIEGDTVFPAWSRKDWQLSAMRTRPADDRNAHELVFARLERIRPPG
ncbi:MAG TPA: type 3 dihydrofolate reductase [Wenzhouxiangella sp.]|nr:type 3 dihydrofolate reductase [Wenzhouxiangella sp.]